MTKLTTNQGVPIGNNQSSRTAGQNGPTLLEDYQLLEKLAHFDRERVPERVVHARGAGAHGVFKVTNSINVIPRQHFFNKKGKRLLYSSAFRQLFMVSTHQKHYVIRAVLP